MNIIITGGNRGIGAGMAEVYRNAGHTVIATSRDGSTGAQLDVADPASIDAFADTVDSDAVDLLICNAGIFDDRHEELTNGYPAALWAKTFAVNVTGVFLSVQALLPKLKAAQAPKIAIISSQLGSSAKASGGSYIYRASKAASLNLGLNLAADLKPEGIAVGIYHPGWVQSDMGGDGAAITVTQSAQGLTDRFETLSLETTGCFQTWDGQTHPI